MSAPAAGWTEAGERGSGFWFRFIVVAYRSVGRWLIFALLHPTALYFCFAAGGARRASRAYLRRIAATRAGALALGGTPGWRDVYRNIHEFARSLYDRFSVLMGDAGRYHFVYHGDEHLRELVEGGRGGILLGSHLGSFEMLRVLAGQHDVTINVVMYTRHAERINAFFRRLDPGLDVNVISLNSGSFGSAFEIRARLERGELVGILADRVAPEERARARKASFLGQPARFPEGPFQLATLLGCPMLMTTGIRTGPERYEVFAEPFYAGGRVARDERDAVIEQLVARYAERLGVWCQRVPHQWFNFFDFWAD